MERIEQLEAEVEALKIVCMSLFRRIDGFTWSEVRELSATIAKGDAEWRQSQPWTDAQLDHLLRVTDSLTGASLPNWQTPLLPTRLLDVPGWNRRPAKPRAPAKKRAAKE